MSAVDVIAGEFCPSPLPVTRYGVVSNITPFTFRYLQKKSFTYAIVPADKAFNNIFFVNHINGLLRELCINK